MVKVSTLRGRLTLLYVVTMTVTVAVGSLLVYWVLSRNLYAHHDEELSRQAEQVVELLAGQPLTEAAIRQTLVAAAVQSRLVMIRDRRGELLYREPILQSTHPEIGRHEALIHAARVGLAAPEFFTVALDGTGDARFICAPLRQAGAYLQIGDPLGDVESLLHSTAAASVPWIAGLLLASSAMCWVIAKRALAPVRSMTATLRDIQATDLGRRVHVHPTDRELGALVATLNRLLDRLERAFDSLRQFAGDVSHQLQTPLTVMKASLASPPDGPDSALLERLKGELDHMSAVVADLRTFALADAPVRAAADVDFSQLVDETADIVEALGELRQVDVTTDCEPGIMVRGDAVRLKQVLLNLGDNAVKYTPAHGRVEIRLRLDAEAAVLEVVDLGPGIPADQVPQLFDRFFRGDAATRLAGGSGLGLAIVKRIVDAHGGAIAVRSGPVRGSVFEVRLPAARPS